MKNLLFISTIVVLLFNPLIFSQQNYEDIIYLKNGSIIRGIIIEQLSNVSLKIRTHDRNVLVFKFNEIEKITKEGLEDDNNINTSFSLQNGFYGLLNLGFLTGGSISGNSNKETIFQSIFAVGGIGGYRINNITRIGIGFEYNNYINGKMFPLFLDLRFNFLTTSKITPICFLNAGYSLGWFKDMQGMDGDGLLFSIGSGVEFYLNNKNNLNISISLRRQWSKGDVQADQRDFFGNLIHIVYFRDVSYNFITIMASFQF